uniref:Uncharacterized protein LOC102800522 n=1 Tax=Saccoglossus kowalevskii TaxID=10224 RepID=A0ABM0MNU1_SACKO|nr:PREDICTED: uncharacterized protein LOC102800522 [Saccoglossus kowalevskii]
MIPEKVEALLQAKRPCTIKQVRSFLGMAGYYQKFVPNFSTIAAPLSDLTRKGQPKKVNWGEPQQKSFDDLKEMLSRQPVLSLPNFAEPFIIRTDASNCGLEAVLLQNKGDHAFPIAYASRKLLDRVTSYSVIEKECLALVWGIHKFQRYLHGREFVIETDHQPLIYLNRAKVLNGRLMRWALSLQPYNYRIVAIKGSHNIGADYLSRSTGVKKYELRSEEPVNKHMGVLECVGVGLIDGHELDDSWADDPSRETADLVETITIAGKESIKDVHIWEGFDDEQAKVVSMLLVKFADTLSDIPGKCRVGQHNIHLTSDVPIRSRPYPLPYALEKTVRDEIQTMLKIGVIEQSNSPYCSPIVLIKKKDDAIRFCIDFRKLNKITIFDAEPIAKSRGNVCPIG